MKKVLNCLLITLINLYSQDSIAKTDKTTFYTYKEIIEIEIILCDELPKNKIYHCLMNIDMYF